MEELTLIMTFHLRKTVLFITKIHVLTGENKGLYIMQQMSGTVWI